MSRKYAIRTWSHSNNAGKILTIDLVDRDGTEIQAAFFNDAASKFDSILQQGQVYLMSRGRIKMANKKFTTIRHPYQIQFDVTAEISEVADPLIQEAFSSVVTFNLTPLEVLG